ncbi:MAG TPA: chemotaxis protein CheX [Acidimicrobiales bacterium]|nr:chemotaxis protein CheX [Acidimicrobiales bacterium]
MTLLSTEEVAQLTQEIWSALLAPNGTPQLEVGGAAGHEFQALTNISGEWNGTVCVSCSRTAAMRATSVMFDIPESEVTTTDVVDAVGELVNVVGGNIKALLPGPTVLSLPNVLEGEPPVHMDNLELEQEVRFSWMAEPVVVSVWASNADD